MGINNPGPVATLDVGGDANVAGPLRIKQNCELQLGTYDYQALALQSGKLLVGQGAVTVDQGKVGVGCVPTYTLDVQGDARV